MSPSSYDKISLVLSRYLTLTVSHLNKVFLVVNDDLHLVKHRNKVLASNNHEFLLNLRDNPYRAYRVIRDMYSLLQNWGRVDVLRYEDKDFYFQLLRDGVTHKFKADTAALLYIELLIAQISELIEDENRYQQFTDTKPS